MAVLGLPEQVRACLFDLDGVLTDTARVHRKAWKTMFDTYLRQRAEGSGEPFVPFDADADYLKYVDGKKRESLRPGDFFGEISCLLGVPPTADIVAERPLRCLVLPASQLEGFLVANPRVMYKVLQGEARKLRSTIGWHS